MPQLQSIDGLQAEERALISLRNIAGVSARTLASNLISCVPAPHPRTLRHKVNQTAKCSNWSLFVALLMTMAIAAVVRVDEAIQQLQEAPILLE